MKPTLSLPIRKITTLILVFVLMLNSSGVFSQTTKSTTPKQTTNQPRKSADKMAIDSLNEVISNLDQSLRKSESAYKEQKLTNADLKDQVSKLEQYKKKLEENNQDFKGENLKLNQSNRILIIFNSLVAVLLVITLVFFLKRLSRKKTPNEVVTHTPVTNGEPSSSTRFASFEDRLLQLERLGKLREKGLLSEAEFVAEKQKVLGK